MFTPFPKIPRLKRNIVITEKIDGTNAQVFITSREELVDNNESQKFVAVSPTGEFVMFAGSRNRFITPTDDNYGFAKWVEAHADELFTLGEGQHFGEWFGLGIQRGYGLQEKRFALFNVNRWQSGPKPVCCETVPVLYRGPFTDTAVDEAMANLDHLGSCIPGASTNTDPEGVIVWHEASRSYFKRTFEHDETGKPE